MSSGDHDHISCTGLLMTTPPALCWVWSLISWSSRMYTHGFLLGLYKSNINCKISGSLCLKYCQIISHYRIAASYSYNHGFFKLTNLFYKCFFDFLRYMSYIKYGRKRFGYITKINDISNNNFDGVIEYEFCGWHDCDKIYCWDWD